MFYLIEDESQLIRFRNTVRNKECYVEVVQSNDRKHPVLDTVIAVYVRPFNIKKGFIVNISHSDCLPLESLSVTNVLSECKALYVLDKKHFLHLAYHARVVDVNVSLTLLYEKPIIKENYFVRKEAIEDINRTVPITKIYEQCEKRYETVNTYYKKIEKLRAHRSWTFFNNTYLKLLMILERNGLYVTDEFFSFYENVDSKYMYDSGSKLCYNSYNLLNRTGRPTNSFNGVNFAAIKKGADGPRSKIIPRYDNLVEVDYKAFHLTLISELINYDVKGDIYEHLNEYYKLSTRKEAKQKTLMYLYNNSPSTKKYLNTIPFFKKVNDFVDSLWKSYTKKGFVTVPISKRVFIREKDGNGLDKWKLFNYYLQSYETSKNIHILHQIVIKLRERKLKTCPVLYVYDAILFDAVEKEHSFFEEILNETMIKNNVKITYKKAKNYVFS